MEKEINRWYKKLWETKGSRFNSAKRLELHEKWSTITISIISVYIVSLNLIVLFPISERVEIFNNNNITFSTICLSILILVISLILNSRNYKVRASKFHDCGREINEVYDKVCIWRSTGKKVSESELLNLSKIYYSVLDKYENHERLDFLLFKSNNLDAYEGHIKCPKLFWLWTKTKYHFITMIIYWFFLLVPFFLYFIILK